MIVAQQLLCPPFNYPNAWNGLNNCSFQRQSLILIGPPTMLRSVIVFPQLAFATSNKIQNEVNLKWIIKCFFKQNDWNISICNMLFNKSLDYCWRKRFENANDRVEENTSFKPNQRNHWVKIWVIVVGLMFK